jgi:hypothetical protein
MDRSTLVRSIHEFQLSFVRRNLHWQNASLLISVDIKKFAESRLNRSHRCQNVTSDSSIFTEPCARQSARQSISGLTV